MLGITGAEKAEKKESIKANRSKKSQKENGVCNEGIEVEKCEGNRVRPRSTTAKLSRIRIRAGAGQQKKRNILMMKIIQLRKMVVRKCPEEENQ